MNQFLSNQPPSNQKRSGSAAKRTGIIALACALFYIIVSCFLREPVTPPEITPTLAPSITPGGPTPGPMRIQAFGPIAGLTPVPPAIYQFGGVALDWQTLHPEWGPVGYLLTVYWDDINTDSGVYDWSSIDDILLAQSAYTVTMLDGSEPISKPIILQVQVHTSAPKGANTCWHRDHTPDWVYAGGVSYTTCDGRKVGYKVQGSDGSYAVMPRYDDSTWQTHYFNFIAALGARYNAPAAGTPASMIVAIGICSGIDGETQAEKGVWTTAAKSDVTTSEFKSYVIGVYLPSKTCTPEVSVPPYFYWDEDLAGLLEAYRDAFADTYIYIQNATSWGTYHDCNVLTRRVIADAASLFTPPIGFKNNNMLPDIGGHDGSGAYWGQWRSLEYYSDTVPIWAETTSGISWHISGFNYWTWLATLHYHPDAIDVHADWLTNTAPSMLQWSAEHLGVTITDTPSIWVALRDYECTKQGIDPWVSGHYGNWNFWLYQVEVVGDGDTVRLGTIPDTVDCVEPIPDPVPYVSQDHSYSRQCRATDQDNDDFYMYFDIDDAWPYAPTGNADLVPFEWVTGTLSYEITLKFINHVDGASDCFWFEYKDYAAVTQTIGLCKGTWLGPTDSWVTYTIGIADAYFNNNMPSSTDFRIDCRDDGDEYIHMVEIVPRISEKNVTQDIEIYPGAHPYSANLRPMDGDTPITTPVDFLADIGTDYTTIAQQTAVGKFDLYGPGLVEIDRDHVLEEMNYAKGFVIDSEITQTLTITGTRFPAMYPVRMILFEREWYLVPFYPTQAAAVGDALTAIYGGYEVCREESQGTYENYYPEHPELSTLDCIKPGLGYWIKDLLGDYPDTIFYPHPEGDACEEG